MYTYNFTTATNFGTYWYHSHVRDFYQDGIRGPILIRAASATPKPFHLISNLSNDISSLIAAEDKSQILMLSDWFHSTSEAIRQEMQVTMDSMLPLCADSILFNGVGRVQCPPQEIVASLGLNSKGCQSMASMPRKSSFSSC